MSDDRETKELKSMVQNSVTISRVTNSDTDADLDSVFQITQNGQTADSMCLMPYGLSANAPRGSMAITFSNNGSSDSKVSIPGFPENRFRDLKEWEVKVGNFKTKAHVFFNDDGEMVLKLDNVTASDNYMVRYNELKAETDQLRLDFNAFVSAFNLHTHAIGVIATVPAALAVVAAMQAQTTDFDIADCKIEKIRVP